VFKHRNKIIGYLPNGCPVREIAGGSPDHVDGAPADYMSRLVREFDSHTEAMQELVERAAGDGGRLLTADEEAEVKRHEEAGKSLAPQIERWKNIQQTRTQVTRTRELLPVASGRVEFTPAAGGMSQVERTANEAAFRKVYRTAGAFLRDDALRRGRSKDAAAGERIVRALEHMLTSDTPGLLPVPFVGDLLGRISAVRPLVESSNRQPLPASGMQFKRPVITQHTEVDVQVTEKTEVASQKMTVGSLPVDLETLAGAVNMSIQEIERSDPSALDLVFQDLAAQYGKRTELRAAAMYVEGTDTSATVDDPIDETSTAEEIRQALYEASGLIYAATDGTFPNVIYASMDMWALIGRYSRAINPQDRDVLSSPDSLTLSIAGIPVVVSPALPAGTLDAARSSYFETYEQPGAPVELRALEVSVLGWEVGVYGMFAGVVTDAGAFVHLAAGS